MASESVPLHNHTCEASPCIHSKDMHHLLIFPIKTGIFLYRNNLPNLFDSFMTAPMASQSKQGMVDV
jgi:hypothetical protein